MIADTNFGINIGKELEHGSSVFTGGTFPTQQFQNDLNYLWDKGFRKVRTGGNSSGFQDAVNLTHQGVLLALAKGFDMLYVLQGPSGNKPSSYTDFYEDYMLPDAQWAQANGVQEIVIGNERESGTTNGTAGRDIITSMTRVSNVVTIVLPTKHNMETGDTFIYYSTATLGQAGSAQIGVTTNVARAMTKIDDYSFSFSNSGTDDTTSVGWIQYTNSAVYKKYKRYATQLKADGITIPLHYSCLQDLATAQVGGWQIATFVALGRGDLDYVDLNIYGGGNYPPNGTIPGRFQDFKDEIMCGLNGFGASHFNVTEWGLGATNSTGHSSTNSINVEYMMKRYNFLKTLGIRYYHFCWRYPGGVLPVKNATRYDLGQTPAQIDSDISEPTFNDWWWPLIGERSPTYTVGAPYVNANIKWLHESRNEPLEPRWSGLAINYGQSEQSGTYSAGNATTAFNNLKALGITRVRIGGGSPTYAAGLTATKQAAVLAKSMGFYVVWVIGANSLTDANWSDHTTFINSEADWALTNRMDELNIGNEYEYYETVYGTLTNSVSKIKTAATDVKTNHFTSGIVSYAMAQSSMDYSGAPGGWIATGKGDLDKLGYNAYGDDGSYTQFAQRITDLYDTFGTNMYVSEWNINSSWSRFPTDESEQNALITQKLNFLSSCGIDWGYFFTYNWIQSSDQFALYLSTGEARGWIDALFQPVNRTATIDRTIATGRSVI